MSNLELKPDIEIRQSHLVAFEAGIADEPEDFNGAATAYQSRVGAAIRAGWFNNGAKVEDISDMAALDVKQFAEDVDNAYGRLMGVEKKQ